MSDILARIDAALEGHGGVTEDYSVGGDAMRWAPDEPEHKPGPVPSEAAYSALRDAMRAGCTSIDELRESFMLAMERIVAVQSGTGERDGRSVRFTDEVSG